VDQATTTETTTEPKRGRGRPKGSRNRPKVPPPRSENGRQAFVGQLTLDVKSIELDGAHWVQIMLGTREWKRFGPFPSADEAAAKAGQLIQHWGGTVTPPATKDILVLNSKPVELSSPEGCAFVRDAVRAAEGLITDSDLRKKYKIPAKNLKEMTKNPALITAIRDERERRMRNGTAARESASRHFVRAPNIMGAIMDDAQANPRHRIEAAREIRATAIGGDDAESAHDTERFMITINLGADTEKFEKEVVLTKKSPPLLENKDEADVEEQWW
jgi:hypothetical protein